MSDIRSGTNEKVTGPAKVLPVCLAGPALNDNTEKLLWSSLLYLSENLGSLR